MKYALITELKGTHSVTLMCRALGLAPSGYYAWKHRPTSTRQRADRVLSLHVRAAFQASYRRYGSPRLHAELRAAGHRVGRKRVARIMRQEGLCARPRRRFVSTTQSRHDQPIAPNVVAREFETSAPNQVWVSDLTYLRTQAGFVYLAVVIDLFSRRVVGWALSRDLAADVATEALRRALALRTVRAGLIHHSDRGIHYACAAYRAILDKNAIVQSMSRKGNCWDNAVAESFFSSLGFELEFESNWSDVHAVEDDLVEYIDRFYNPRRRHSHNDFLSPIDFERQFLQEQVTT